ncbi:MAG: transcriptional regulator, GntR family [Xanthobacteraceae bacterium]|jgi:DNA-binding GntR family transcriptional regulator|nr:transcriptional regulator, GntR family [Xanthobacteraceae bacterium]
MSDRRIERAGGLAAQVYQEIERMILEGNLEPGSRLNEYALADQFAVSRGPVREATRALVEAGLLVSVPARGVFVREMSQTEIAENYDVRAVLTGLMCARAAELRTNEDVAALEGFVAAMDAAIAVGRVHDYYRINLEFHDRINLVAGHGCARRVYDDLIRETHSLRRSLFSPGQTNNEHRAIVAAITAGDAGAARRLGEEHVLHGKKRWMDSASAVTPRDESAKAGGRR